MIYFKVHKENFALLRLSNNQNNIPNSFVKKNYVEEHFLCLTALLHAAAEFATRNLSSDALL